MTNSYLFSIMFEILDFVIWNLFEIWYLLFV